MSVALREIEAVYQGPRGDSYRQRTRAAKLDRSDFWRMILERTRAASLLEVGAGTDANGKRIPPHVTYTALDISRRALTELAGKRVQASALSLPFADQSFDVVVSAGLLMHVPKEDLPAVMREQARVARKHVLLCEYDDQNGQERMIPWHGQKDVLWARPVGIWWWNCNPGWFPVWRKNLTKAEGFDRISGVLFERLPAVPLRHPELARAA